MTNTFTDGAEALLRNLASNNAPLHFSLINDFAFKKVFHNKVALRGLLAALLHMEAEDIQDIQFTDTALLGDGLDDKQGSLDIRLILNSNQKINVEMQTTKFPYWEERSLYYLSRMYCDGFEKGQKYDALDQCVHISILDYDLFPNPPFYFSVGLWDHKNNRCYSDKMMLHVLELSQIKNVPEAKQHTDIYLWAKLFASKDWEVLKMLAKENESMKAVQYEMEKIYTDEQLRYRYLKSEMAASDEATIRSYYTNEGVKDGIKQGIQQGEARLNQVNQLTLRLIQDKRLDDLKRSAKDPDFQEKLFSEYNL